VVQESAPKPVPPPADASALPSWDVTPPPDNPEDSAARRRLVSVQRLHNALAFRLGCRPTGDRGPGGGFWRTTNGIRFVVNDPTFDRDSAAVIGGDGRRQLFYSYKYAAALLYHVLWLNSGARAIHGPSGAEPVMMRPSAKAMGVILDMTEGILREAREAVQQGQTAAPRDGDRPPDLLDRIFI
jgi:hypothetical protein